MRWGKGGTVRISRPVSTNSHVGQNKKRMIEDPGFTRRKISGCAGLVQVAINVEANGRGFPFDSKDVEIVGEFVGRQGVAPAQSVFSPVAGAVNGAMNLVWLLSNVFHDVDLAAVRPVDGADVVAEHPE